MQIRRVYNMILSSHNNTTYVLLGKQNSNNAWALLGGKIDPIDNTYIDTAARELFEETATYINLPLYYYTGTLTRFVQSHLYDTNIPHDYKEMAAFKWFKLRDIVKLADNSIEHQAGYIDDDKFEGWMLYSLKRCDRTPLKLWL